MQHCSEWAMDGFPVVDRASLGETLTGAALVPVPESSETSTNQCYMLCQQSSSGCVYAQLVLPADRDSVSAPVQLKYARQSCIEQPHPQLIVRV